MRFSLPHIGCRRWPSTPSSLCRPGTVEPVETFGVAKIKNKFGIRNLNEFDFSWTLLELDSVEQLDAYPWPNPDDFDYETAAAEAKTMAKEFVTLSPLTVTDVSDYQPRRLPSKKWRELIKQVWEVDPFDCPRCGAEMKLIALIDDDEVIEKILRHLDLWPEDCLSARAPPKPVIQDYIYEPVMSATGGSACGGEDYQCFDEAVW
jgi:hypothetical protein